jgi:hypothetical protein
VLRKKFPFIKESLYAVYIQPQDPFPEIEEFITQSVERYGQRALQTVEASLLTEI